MPKTSQDPKVLYARFAEFIANKRGTYNPWDDADCVLAQFGRFLGFKNVSGRTTSFVYGDLSKTFHLPLGALLWFEVIISVRSGHEWTWARLRKRFRKFQREHLGV